MADADYRDLDYENGEIRDIHGRKNVWLDGGFYDIETIHRSLAITQRAHPFFEQFINIQWQDGPIGPENPVNGADPVDVIEAVLRKMRDLNDGDGRCRENSLAITALEEAQNWLVRRTINRIQQNVEGTTVPHIS